MSSTNMFKFNANLSELNGHAVVEDDMWNDDAKGGPIPNSTRACAVTDFESRIVFYFLTKILQPPRLLGLLSEKGFTQRVGHHRDLKLARTVDVIPMMMGVDDPADRRKTSLSQFVFDAAGELRTVTSIDQHRLILAGDDPYGTLNSH